MMRTHYPGCSDEENRSLRYASAAAAVDDMRRTIPFLRQSLSEMQCCGCENSELYQKTERALAIVEDRDRLRRRLGQLAAKDGTIAVHFSSAASALGAWMPARFAGSAAQALLAELGE